MNWEIAKPRQASCLQFSSQSEDGSWMRQYAALVRYGEIHGHCNVPLSETFDCDLPSLTENGITRHYSGRLGVWVRNQRQRRNNAESGGAQLTPEHEALLQKLVDEGGVYVDTSHDAYVSL
jgi:hypothetical protein